MPDENLLKSIKDGLAQGRSEDIIRSSLLSGGWAQKDIDDAFGTFRTEQTIPASVSSPSVSSITTALPEVGVGVNTQKGMRIWQKVILWVLGVIVALGVVGGIVWAMCGKTISSMIVIQYLVHDNGVLLNITPTPRVLAPITPAASTTFSDLGLTLSVPWEGVSSTKKGGAVAVTVSFTSGKQFTIMKASEPTSSDAVELYKILHVSTGYEFEEAVFNATPNQVSITTPGNKAMLTTLLLTMKSVILVPAPGLFYNFNTGVIKGFQHGDSLPGKFVFVEIYDQVGNKFNLITNATQGEIDYILASVRPQSPVAVGSQNQ